MSARAPLRTRLALGAALSLLGGAAGAGAQQIDPQLQEIRTLVREKRYPLALESLRLVARQIQDLRLGEIAPAFPPGPAGWTAEPPMSLLAEDDIWSDRVEAQRVYREPGGAARLEVTIAVHSPLAPAVALSLNPLAFAAEPQSRAVQVAGTPARLRFFPDAQEGEVRLLLGREVLVTVRGRGIAGPEPLLDLAGRVDYALLRSRAGR